MHTIFARLCLQAKCYRDAMPILDVDAFDFPPKNNMAEEASMGARGFEVGSREVLEFYLYGGMLYAGVKKWRRALDYLAHVCFCALDKDLQANRNKAIATPGSACSMVQVEAYKKFVLIGLLLDGKVHSHYTTRINISNQLTIAEPAIVA
jgi:COP9 signalosome complex subunit 3